MANNILFYPSLQSIGKEFLDYKDVDFLNFYFNKVDTDEELFINVDTDDYNIVMKDDYKRWFASLHNLKLRTKFQLNTSVLFGENGVAPIGSTLGILFRYKCSNTLFSSTSKITSFDASNETLEIDYSYEFIPNTIKGKVIISFELFIVDYKDPFDNEKSIFSNVIGGSLGTIYSKILHINGESSIFPTNLVEDRNRPLWELQYSNDLYSSFEENVMLIINKSHRDYSLFDQDTKDYNEEFIKEVMINIVSQLLIANIDSFDDLIEDNYDVGTIGRILSYYKIQYKIESKNIADIYKNISLGVRR